MDLLPALLEYGILHVICLQVALKRPSITMMFSAHRCMNEHPPVVRLWWWWGGWHQLPPGCPAQRWQTDIHSLLPLLARCLVLILALFFPRWLQFGCFQLGLAKLHQLLINVTITIRGYFLCASCQLLPVPLMVLYCLSCAKPCAKLRADGHAEHPSSRSSRCKEQSNMETQHFKIT